MTRGYQRSEWTDERIKRLKQDWADGYSASQIASRMGGTRNSIIGKVFRLGLEQRRSSSNCNGRLPENHPWKSKDRCKQKRKRKQQFNFGTVSSLLPCQKKAPGTVNIPRLADTPALPPLNIPLIETTYRQCKFIPGHDGLTCGHPVKPGSVYCPAHHRICFTPMPPRARRVLTSSVSPDPLQPAKGA